MPKQKLKARTTEIIELYVNDHLTIPQIALKIFSSASRPVRDTISEILKDNGVKLFSRKKHRNLPRVLKICPICDKQFCVSSRRNTIGKKQFCSKKCQKESYKKNKMIIKCARDKCDVYFETTKRNNGKLRKKYCSNECYKLDFQPKNFNQSTNKGYFVSTKSLKKMYFESNYELRRMKQYDLDTNIISWDRCSNIKIPYIGADGNKHNYYPDFLIQYKNNTKKTIEEVKGLINENDVIKIKTAIQWAEENNYDYKVINYNDINATNEIDILYDEYDNRFGHFYRISFIYTLMKIALLISNRSTCLRAQVGCVIALTSCWNIFSFGYNGSLPGEENACKSLEPGNCGCTHAEINAINKLQESNHYNKECILFCTTLPCLDCTQAIIKYGNIKRVIYLKSYRLSAGHNLLLKYNIIVDKYSDLVVRQNEKLFISKRSV